MNFIVYILNFLKLSSLTVIIGSTITLGALMAPVIFKILERADAARLMVEIFSRYDSWLKVAAIVLLVSYSLDFFFVKKLNGSIADLFALLGVVLIAALSFYLVYNLSPEINQAYEVQAENFQNLHALSEKIHKINFLLGILVLISSFVI